MPVFAKQQNIHLIFSNNTLQINCGINATFLLYDAMGKAIINTPINQSKNIDMTGYVKGFYFAKVICNGESSTKKFIVE